MLDIAIRVKRPLGRIRPSIRMHCASLSSHPLPVIFASDSNTISRDAAEKSENDSLTFRKITPSTTDCSKRVFILGPSHHVHLNGCALTKFFEYATPLGNLPVDRTGALPFFSVMHKSSLRTVACTVLDELMESGEFSLMSRGTDEEEHSIELHLPLALSSSPHALSDVSRRLRYIRRIFEG